jgi:hypothetical protein
MNFSAERNMCATVEIYDAEKMHRTKELNFNYLCFYAHVYGDVGAQIFDLPFLDVLVIAKESKQNAKCISKSFLTF